MEKITLPEASLFLLFFTANLDILDEQLLSEKEATYIHNCVNKWGFYDSFYTQSDLESAIAKYQTVKSGSADSDDFIEQCAEILTTSPPIRDITYYLCIKILFIEGPPSEEDVNYLGQLERILEVNHAVSNVAYGIATIDNTLYE